MAGAPRAAVTGPRRGASRPRARRHARTSAPPNSSLPAGTTAKRSRARDQHHDAFRMEGPVYRWILAAQGGSRALVGPSRDDQDLEPALDHSAAIRRPELRRL